MITVVALLTVRDADAFDRYERQAIAIMQSHGGRLESAFRPDKPSSKQGSRIDEIHILKFPDLTAFENYKSDEKLAAIAPLREQAIAQTSVYVSTQVLDYSTLDLN